jgi:surface protein
MHLFQKKNCSSGFYLDKRKCKLCSIENCDKCFLKESIEICSSCNPLYFPIYDNKNIESCEIYDLGDEDKCLQTESNTMQCLRCNLGYKLSGGKCIPNYSFKAIYFTNENNQNIKLINEDFKTGITEMIIDNNKVEVSNEFTFQKKGKHKVYFYIESQLENISEMFKDIKNMIYISFLSNFDTEELMNMSGLFSGCSSLTSIDLSYFNTKNVFLMSNVFNGCSSLESVDIANFNTENVNTMESMFSGCTSLTSLDISNFNTKSLLTASYMFYNCKNIKYLNIVNLDVKSNYKDILKGMSFSSKIIMNDKFYKKLLDKKEIQDFENIEVK